jgi:Cell division protein
MLDLVDDNPIPPFFRIKLDDRSKTPIDLIEVRKSIARDGVFEEVQAPVDWVNRIAEWKFKMVFWPVTICVLLLVTLSLIICNSVRLSLLSRKLLVENMKYAGGSTFFIQFPFVLEGLAQGLFGSVLAVIVLWMVVDAFTESFPIVGSYVDGFGGILFLVVLAVSSLSTYFSFHTVRGFLKIKRNEQELETYAPVHDSPVLVGLFSACCTQEDRCANQGAEAGSQETRRRPRQETAGTGDA